jgi:hypothetical protein
MDTLGFITLIVTGFTACAEFGSYAFVHPVIRRLPAREHVQVEQGLLKTFGRVMPVAMTLCLALAIADAARSGGQAGPPVWRWLAVSAFGLSLASTIVFNVPINLATGRWDADDLPGDWKATRERWELFQGVRSWLLLVGFVLVSAGFAIG